MPELVAIDLPGGRGFVDALRSVWDDGDAALPVDQRLAGPARKTLLDTMAPGRVITPGGTESRPAGRPVDAGDALVVATSGTTGAPRGVILTHDAVAASARATSARLGVDPAVHHWLACLPLNHVGGLSVVTRAVLTGAALTVLPGFDVDAVLAASGPDTFVSLVPTALARVGADRFHTVVLGGSAPPRGLPANVVTTYGLTETGSGVVYDGKPLDGVEVRLAGDQAEILLRGPMLLRAYRDGTSPLDPDGWLPTGDSGRLGGDGRLQVAGRLSDLIISGGENIWPGPIEALLGEHPGVAEVAVAGQPDPEWGQRVVAFVVPRPGQAPPTLEALRALVRDRLAAYAAPRQLVLIDALPKTAIGKVRRSALTDQAADLPVRPE